MPRPLVSIVLATYQRAHLLARSLECYERSSGLDPQTDLELVVVDDHSTDNTRELVSTWSKRTRIKSTVLTVSPKPGEWVDCGWILNAGIRASTGKHILLTHPEVMPGKKSVIACVEKLDYHDNSYDVGQDQKRFNNPYGPYACCRVYYLSPKDQVLLDSVNWRGEQGVLAVREIEGFYEQVGGNPDYSHRATDIVAQPGSRLPYWESWVFGGCSRETWKRLGGMLVSQKWGAVDVAWHARRRTLGIPNHTCPADDTIVIHQNHNLPGDVETPRDMDAWVKELKDWDFTAPNKLVYPAIDELGWG